MAEEVKAAGVAENGAGAPGKKPKAVKLIALAALLCVAGWGINHYLEGQKFEDTDDAFLEGRIVPVSSRVAGHARLVLAKDNQEVKAGDPLVEIDRRDFELRLERAKAALEVARARAASSDAAVEYAKASTGAGVGEAASGVDRAKAAVATSRAAIDAAQARVEMALAMLTAAKMQAAQTESQIIAAQSRAALAASDAKRYASMFEKGIVTAQQNEQALTASHAADAELAAVKSLSGAAKAQEEAARANEKTAREALAQAKALAVEAESGVGQATARLAQAKGGSHQIDASRSSAQALAADVGAAQAAVRQAELDLAYTSVAAPEGGRITKKAVEPGQFVSTGQALMALVPKDLWVVANFKETQLKKMRPGQNVKVEIDAYPGREFSARIDSIQTGTGARFSLLPPENATGNYVKVVQRLPVKIVFTEPLPPELALGPGMSVTPKVDVR